MSGDLEVHAPGHSTEANKVEQLSSECDDSEQREWGGVAFPFPYDSCAAEAYRDDHASDATDEAESEVPNWLLNALQGLERSPLKGLGPTIMAGILRAAAGTAVKVGKGGKAAKKTAAARAAPRKGGAPLLSKEEWNQRIEYFLVMKKNWVAFRARFKDDGDIVKPGTFTKYVKRYEEEKAKAQAPGSARTSGSDGSDSWSVIEKNLMRKPGGKP